MAQLNSTIVTGSLNVSGSLILTGSMLVSSSALVGNLNADQVDGQHGAYYLDLTNATGTLSDIRLSSNAVFKSGSNTFTVQQIIDLQNGNNNGRDYLRVNLSGSNTLATLVLSASNAGPLGFQAWDSSSSAVGFIQARDFRSLVPTGTSPLTVASTTLVANLNAERISGQTLANLDGRYLSSGSYFTTAQSDARYLLLAGGTVGPLTGSSGLTLTSGKLIVSGSSILTGSVGIIGNTTITGTVSGISTLTATNIVGALTGNASTTTALQTARQINGVSFDGTTDITIPAAAGSLTGNTLAANVLTSSLASVGTLTSLTVAGTLTLTAASSTIIPGSTNIVFRNNANNASNLVITDAGTITVRGAIGGATTITATTFVGALSGNASTATTLQTPRAINGVNFDGSSPITVTAAASTLSDTSLAPNVVVSSLTSVGILTALNLSGPISGTVANFTGIGEIGGQLQIKQTSTTQFASAVLRLYHTQVSGSQQFFDTFLENDGASPGLGAAFKMRHWITLGSVSFDFLNYDLTSHVATWSGSAFIFSSGITAPTFTGNASTATALQTPRAINGVNFDGTSAITVTAAANTLTGTTLASGVVASSLTSVGTLASLAVTNNITAAKVFTGTSGSASTATLSAISNGNGLEFGHNNTLGFRGTIGAEAASGLNFIAFHSEAGTSNNTYRTRGLAGSVLRADGVGGFGFYKVATVLADNQSLTTLATLSNTGALTATSFVGSLTGNASTATALQTPRAINGVNFDGTSAITITVAGSALTGTTLASNIVGSSLTSVGTLSSLSVTGAITQGGNQVLHAGNYNSYTPTLTGTGASGTWAISISGLASTAASARILNLFDGASVTTPSFTTGTRSSTQAPTSYQHTIAFEFKDGSFYTGPGNYRGVLTIAPWDSTTASTGDPSYQMVFAPAGVSSTSPPSLAIRAGIDSTWGSWSTVLHSNNVSSYALPSGGGTLGGLLTLATTGLAITGLDGGIFSSSNFIYFARRSTAIGLILDTTSGLVNFNGAVTVGTDPGGSESVRIGGDIRLNGKLKFLSGDYLIQDSTTGTDIKFLTTANAALGAKFARITISDSYSDQAGANNLLVKGLIRTNGGGEFIVDGRAFYMRPVTAGGLTYFEMYDNTGTNRRGYIGFGAGTAAGQALYLNADGTSGIFVQTNGGTTSINGGPFTVTGGTAGFSGGTVTINPTIAAGAGWGLVAVGIAGAARDIALFGQNGFSNGFTIQYDGTRMLYNMASGNLTVNGENTVNRTTFISYAGGSSSGTWKGRGAFGGDIYQVVLGETNSIAVIGAHNSALNAWAPLYINNGSNQPVIIGGDPGGSQLLRSNSTVKFSDEFSSSKGMHDLGLGTVRVVNPGGASLFVGGDGSVVTGAIRIKLPTACFNNATMMSFAVKIYNYATGTSTVLRVGGYNYTGGNWINVFAEQATDSGINLNVRFGNDGTSNCVWIGETSTTWSYPQIAVHDFMGGYAGGVSAWSSGWNISFVTAFNTVDITRQAALAITQNSINSFAPTLTGGGASGTWNITAANATNVAWSGITNKPTRTNWASLGNETEVAYSLSWNYYGNNHTIFDASSGISPSGTTIPFVDSQNAWIATYGTLMGWNGSQTYGVRVDRARIIDNQANSATIGCTTTNTANAIVQRDGNGDISVRYVLSQYINSSDDVSSGTISNIVAKFGDNYHRSATPQKVANFLSGVTISLDATTFTNHVRMAQAIGIYHSDGGTDYTTAALMLRERALGGTSAFESPRLAFHWGGVVASQISVESSGRISILNNPGTAYENLIANNIYGNAFFTTSNRASKQNITPFNENALDILNSVDIVNFEYITNPGIPKVGFIAEDTHQLLTTPDRNVLDNATAIGLLIKAVQELTLENKTLKKLIAGGK